MDRQAAWIVVYELRDSRSILSARHSSEVVSVPPTMSVRKSDKDSEDR
jgi:hypothetical protein